MQPTAEMTIERVREFYDFLTNQQLPDGMCTGRGNQPRLTGRQAFSVIWFLQEHLHIIPDHFDRCDDCGSLFDSDQGGWYSEERGKQFCEKCLCKYDREPS